MEDWATLPDKLLLEAALEGSSEAWEALFQMLNRRAFAYLRHEITDPSRAEDLVQTVWEEFFEYAFEKPVGRPWMLFKRILSLRKIDVIRSNSRSRERLTLDAPVPTDRVGSRERLLLDLQESSEPDPADAAVEEEDASLVQQAISRLPPHYQRVIRARYIEGRPFREVADILIAEGLDDPGGDEVKRAQDYAYRAKTKLAEHLTALGIDRGR